MAAREATDPVRIRHSTKERIDRAAWEFQVELGRKVTQAEIIDDAMVEFERRKAAILQRKRSKS